MNLLAQLRRYAAGAWRHRWLALLLAWVVCLVGWTTVQRIPDQYRASARVFAAADAILGQTLRGIAVDGATAAQVEYLQRTLLSRPNIERVIARTDLDQRVTSSAQRQELVTALGRQIRIVPQTRNLFQVQYTDHDPRLAHSVVRTTLDLFMESAASNDRQQMENATAFVGQQLASYEQQLREAERRRAEFRTRFFELLPDSNLGGASRLESSRNRLAGLNGQLEDVRARRELTRQQLAAAPASLPAARGGGGGGPVAQAEANLRQLLTRYTDQHPEVASARAAIAAARAQPATGGGGGGPVPNPAREQLQLRLVDADSEIASLERQLRDETANLARLEELIRARPQVQAEFQNLDRDYNVLRRNYEELLGRRESLQIAGAARVGADQVRLEVVDPPSVPSRPSGPNRLLLSAGVLAAGLGAGAALAFGLALLDQSFYTVRDLRSLGLPVLGGLTSQRPVRRAGAFVAFGGGLALLLLAAGAVMVGGPRLVARLPDLVARVLA